MLGAGPYLARDFGLPEKKCQEILWAWIDSFKKKSRPIGKLLVLLALLALPACNSRLLHPHETGSDQQAVVADHIAGTITTEFQTIDIRTMDTTQPFTVKINGELLNQYEYKFLNDNRAIVWIRRKAEIDGQGVIHFHSTSAAVPGDSYLIETVLP